MITPRSKIPDHDLEDIKREYDAQRIEAEKVLVELRSELAKRLKLAALDCEIKARVKSFKSYYFKHLKYSNQKKEVSKAAARINDVLGLRIICPFLEDLGQVEVVLHDSFEVIEVERKDEEQSYDQFGYSATHVLIAVPHNILKSYALKPTAVCEIQLRTILQDAWAKIEHELVYKAEFTPFDEPLKRKLAALNANLTLSDLIFQEIRDYQRGLQSELIKRRKSLSRKIQELCGDKTEDNPSLSRSPSVNQVEKVTSAKVSFGAGTMDDLLVKALSSHNAGQYTTAISLYTSILKMATLDHLKALVRVHRGMAYFAEGSYKTAMADFDESIRLKPDNAKALYYRGVILQILEDYEASRKDLTLSVRLNPFQFDALFQRAQTYYHLGDYSRALEDCEKAIRIEPDSVLVQRLIKLLRSHLGA